MNKKKKKKIVVIAAIILAVISIIAIIAGVVVANKKGGKDTLYVTENFDETEIYEMPKSMAFTAKSLAAANEKGQAVNVKIKATVIPDDASNKAVDFSVEWGYATVHKDEAVTDFVTVTQEYDGSVNATVSCKKAFDTDKIIVKVTTREGGFTAKCTVTFLGVATSLNISSTEVTSVSSTERGVYYQLGIKKTYTFNIALDNDFGNVGSKILRQLSGRSAISTSEMSTSIRTAGLGRSQI